MRWHTILILAHFGPAASTGRTGAIWRKDKCHRLAEADCHLFESQHVLTAAHGPAWSRRRPPENLPVVIDGGHTTEILLHNFVGAGGSAGKLVSPDSVVVSDPLEERHAQLHSTFRVETTADNVKAAATRDVIFVNLRPEVVGSVIPELLATGLDRDQVVISLAALANV